MVSSKPMARSTATTSAWRAKGSGLGDMVHCCQGGLRDGCGGHSAQGLVIVGSRAKLGTMEPDSAGKDPVDSLDAQLVRVGDVDDLAGQRPDDGARRGSYPLKTWSYREWYPPITIGAEIRTPIFR